MMDNKMKGGRGSFLGSRSSIVNRQSVHSGRIKEALKLITITIYKCTQSAGSVVLFLVISDELGLRIFEPLPTSTTAFQLCDAFFVQLSSIMDGLCCQVWN